jgi:hypothetical protein
VAALKNSTEVADEYGALARHLVHQAEKNKDGPALGTMAQSGTGTGKVAEARRMLQQEYVTCLKRENAQRLQQENFAKRKLARPAGDDLRLERGRAGARRRLGTV